MQNDFPEIHLQPSQCKVTVPSPNPEIKTEYERTMEVRLGELGAKIDQWSAKAEVVTAQKLEELKIKHHDAAIRFDELKAQSGEAWSEFKVGMDKCFDELKQAREELKIASEKAAAKFHK